jgi:hypothetical protein
MAVVAALGLVARPHEREPFAPGSTIPHPLRALRLRIARSRRYLSLLWLAARYGLGPLRGIRPVRSDETVGVALRDALQEAGGIFIKFGQMLSARTDLVPAAIALELSSLQDDCAPLPVEGLRSNTVSSRFASADSQTHATPSSSAVSPTDPSSPSSAPRSASSAYFC